MTAWQHRALCRYDEDPERWFPVQDRPSPHEIEEPIRICGNCPVQAECAAFAADPRNRVTAGIWAGKLITKEERTVAGSPKPDRITRIRGMLAEGLDVEEICTRLDLARATVEKLLSTIRRQDRIATAGPSGVTRNGARKPARCGTDGGYYRHRRVLLEEACKPCKAAHAAAMLALEQRKRARMAVAS